MPRSWEKVGAAPLTRDCLCDTKVRHELGADEDDDPLAGQIRKLQEQNDHCVAGLNSFGCRGSFLAETLKEFRPATQRSFCSCNLWI